MASRALLSGLHTLVQAVEAAEAAAKKKAESGSNNELGSASSSRRRARQVEGGFECPHPGCARIFSKRYNQQAHMRLHDGTKPFGCEQCGKAFMWKSSLKSHAKMHAKMKAKLLGDSRSRRGSGGVGKKRSKKNCKVTEGGQGAPQLALPAVVSARGREGGKAESGRQSPNSVSMMDHDAATVLTMFR